MIFKPTPPAPNIIIDCSHGNSQKKCKNQKIVIQSICEQIANGQQKKLGSYNPNVGSIWVFLGLWFSDFFIFF